MSFAPAPLQIIDRVTPEHLVLIVRGEVDLVTASQFQHALTDRLSHASPNLHVNLADVSFMDSSGLHALLVGQRTARLLGGDLILVRTSTRVERLLALSGVPFTTAPETLQAEHST